MMCDNGSLLDVVEKQGEKTIVRRHLFCLAGMEDPETCVYHLVKKIKEYKQSRYSY
jgi:hypothetical protein